MDVSVIIPSHNEGPNLKKTVDSIIRNTIFSQDYEIIVVDDASTDKSTNFLDKIGYRNVKLVKSQNRCPNKTRNIGAENAHGDMLFFLDAHVFPVTKNWMADMYNFIKNNKKSICGPCISVYGDPETKGYGFSIKGPKLEIDWMGKLSETPYEVPFVGAACLAIDKGCFFDMGGFNNNFLSWGYEDIELCMRAWLLGCKVFILPGIEVSHLFRETFPYDIENEHIIYNLLVTCVLHFNHKRAGKIINELSKESDVTPLLNLIRKNNILRLRKSIIERRKYNDDWFFEKFNLKMKNDIRS